MIGFSFWGGLPFLGGVSRAPRTYDMLSYLSSVPVPVSAVVSAVLSCVSFFFFAPLPTYIPTMSW